MKTLVQSVGVDGIKTILKIVDFIVFVSRLQDPMG